MKKSSKRKFQKLLVGSNILFALLYGLVCLLPFMKADTFWIIAVLGIFFPVLLLINLLFLLGWLIKRSWWALLSFCIILLGWQQISVMVAFGAGGDNAAANYSKEENTLRVLSWNVSKWDETNKGKRGGASYRKYMMDFIEMQNADVLCLSEFFESYDIKRFEQNLPYLEKMGFTYHYFFPTSSLANNSLQFGLCILSKYPVIDSASFTFDQMDHSEGICYVDILVASKKIRVFAVHLESPGLNKKDIGNGQAKASTRLFNKIRRSYVARSLQANKARTIINASPYPSIVCSDIGTVPTSYSYFRLRGNMKDAFLAKGSGFGRTYRFISPTLRIDYIFADKQLKVEKFLKPAVTYSDHFPIIADISYQ